jgi:hypothetical protein
LIALWLCVAGGDGDGHDEQQLRRGTVKWFNVAKGWGFLIPHDGGTEVFVYQVGSFQ